MKAVVSSLFIYFILMGLCIIAQFIPGWNYESIGYLLIYLIIIRFFYRNSPCKSVEIKDVIFALLFTLILYFHMNLHSLDDFLILMAINLITIVNFAATIRYKML